MKNKSRNYYDHYNQKEQHERISFRYLLTEIFHFFTHIESRFLVTSIQMIQHPGKTVMEFIEGNRKKYQSPISYFLVWTTLYVVFFFLVENLFGKNTVINYRGYFGPDASTKTAISHLGIVLIILIPFQALFLQLLVTRHKYNYVETMATVIYLLGTIILFQFIFVILSLVIHLFTGISVKLELSDAFKILYLGWFIVNFSRQLPVHRKLLRSIAFTILAFGAFTLWRVYGYPEIMRFIHPGS